VVRGGWEGVLIYQGQWTNIELDDSSETSQVTFYFPAWPVTTSLYVVTDAETDVTLYDDGVAVSSDDWTLDGSEGTCVFDSAPVAGSHISATFYFKETVGYWKGIDFEHDNSIEEVYCGGQRGMYAAKEHQIKLKLKVDAVYIDLRELNRVAAKRYSVTSLPDMTAVIQTAASGGDQLTLTGVKFNKAKLSMSAGKVHGYNVDAIAISAAQATT
jgi:hypothetical protein